MNDAIRSFEVAFAHRVGANYAIALCNGTATLHTALAALGHQVDPILEGVQEVIEVRVPPLTMASTAIAVIHAGCIPWFVDVDPDTWLMQNAPESTAAIPVSLYGLRWSGTAANGIIVDAAQTLQAHDPLADFTSYSFQQSKIINLGEGGMLVTNDKDLATKARQFSSLGYEMDATEPRIAKEKIKAHDAVRHHTLGWNYRMSPIVAERGLFELTRADGLLMDREFCAEMYESAIRDCPWIKPQHVPAGWTHDYWCYPVAVEDAELRDPFIAAVVRNGGEKPYCAWRLTYQEPAFRNLAEDGTCPVAEDLQPRIIQFQTNKASEAIRTATAIERAIREING